MKQLNLVFRFLMELTAIVTFGIWGYSLADSSTEITRILLAILFPLIFALLWGIFAVKNDPSRSGKTVIPTPGVLRLLLELFLFGSAICMLSDLGHSTAGWVLLAAVLLHYIISFDRIRWLLKQK